MEAALCMIRRLAATEDADAAVRVIGEVFGGGRNGVGIGYKGHRIQHEAAAQAHDICTRHTWAFNPRPVIVTLPDMPDCLSTTICLHVAGRFVQYVQRRES
jgi:hypothetical protein